MVPDPAVTDLVEMSVAQNRSPCSSRVPITLPRRPSRRVFDSSDGLAANALSSAGATFSPILSSSPVALSRTVKLPSSNCLINAWTRCISSGGTGLTRSLIQVTASLGAATRSPIAAQALAASVSSSACQHVSRSAGVSALAAGAGRSTLVTSQIKAVPSELAEATVLPSGDNSNSCCSKRGKLAKARISRPVRRSRTLILPSE
jgi:hypothetical protein